jgi:NAD(P)-dependent dehydrogenase (short-subunit alcohol dehydrogenase family)
MNTRALIITGGSGGIGRCTALAAAEQGWDVCVNYYSRNSSPADEIVALIEKGGGKAIAVHADITKEEDVISLFDICTDRLGTVRGLVNCAGMSGPVGRIDELKYEELLPLINLNVSAVFLCCREAVKRMSTRHGGHGGSIVLVSSGAARLGSPGSLVPYAASKGAVDVLGWGLAQEGRYFIV